MGVEETWSLSRAVCSVSRGGQTSSPEHPEIAHQPLSALPSFAQDRGALWFLLINVTCDDVAVMSPRAPVT